jgi:hypothetical protein
MPERATVTQGVQAGVESVLGTSVAANKLFNSLSLELNEQVDLQRFRPTGSKYPTIITPGREWAAGSLSGRLSYTECIYPLASITNYAAPVQQGATTAYLWTFIPVPRSDDTFKSYTFEYGSATRAHKATGCVFTEFGFSWSRETVDLSGSIIGQLLTDGISLTGSPSSLPETPVIPNNIDVFMDSTSAGLGTTKLTRVLSGSFSIGTKFNPVWPIDSSKTSWASLVEVEPVTRLTLLVEADTQGMSLLPIMRAGTTQFIRLIATSPILAGTAFPFKFQLDMAVKVSDVGDFSDSDGVYALEYTFDAVNDAGWGKPYQILVTNQQTLL